MRPRLLVLVAVTLAPGALADELAGSWRVQTRDIAMGPGCTLEGTLVLKETSGAMACELTLVQQCKNEKGKYLIVREPCSYSRKGQDVLIKGTSYEIVEAEPPRKWSRFYKLDTFDLKVQPDNNTMTGMFKGYDHARATLTRMRTLAE